MLPSDRIPYSAITERAPLKLPNGARMAVWAVINVEEWDPMQPMPRTVLTGYMKRHYAPPNVVVAAAGTLEAPTPAAWLAPAPE